MSMNLKLRTSLAGLAAAAMFLGACGGGTDGVEDAADDVGIGVVAEDQSGTDIEPASLSGTTAESAIGSETPATLPVPDSTPLDSSGDDQLTETTPQFCDAGYVAYESWVVLDLVPTEAKPEIVEPAMTQLLIDINLALEVAPNEELATAPRYAFTTMNNIRNFAIEHGYDGDAMADAISPEVAADYDAFLIVMDALSEYLEGPCGMDLGGARTNATTRLGILESNAANRPAQNPVEQTPEVEDIRYIESNWGDIQVAVPAGWDQEESWVDGRTRNLAVSSDLAAYDSSWRADGLQIFAADLTADDDVNLERMLASTAAWNECTQDSAAPYSDGLYSGEIHRFVNCDGGQTGAAVITAVSDDGAIAIIVQVQMIDFNEAIMTLIADSFRA